MYRAGCANDTNTSQHIVCNLTNEQRIGVYGGLTGLVVVLSVGRNMLFFLLILRSSRLFHNKMFGAVLRAPVLFFDTNPVGKSGAISINHINRVTFIGRVLNRFSKDVGFLDDVLPYLFCEYVVVSTVAVKD